MSKYDGIFKRLRTIEGIIADANSFFGLELAIMTKSYCYDVSLEKFKKTLEKCGYKWYQDNFNAKDRVYTFPTTKSSIKFYFPEFTNVRGIYWDAVFFDEAANIPIELMEQVVISLKEKDD